MKAQQCHRHHCSVKAGRCVAVKLSHAHSGKAHHLCEKELGKVRICAFASWLSVLALVNLIFSFAFHIAFLPNMVPIPKFKSASVRCIARSSSEQKMPVFVCVMQHVICIHRSNVNPCLSASTRSPCVILSVDVAFSCVVGSVSSRCSTCDGANRALLFSVNSSFLLMFTVVSALHKSRCRPDGDVLVLGSHFVSSFTNSLNNILGFHSVAFSVCSFSISRNVIVSINASSATCIMSLLSLFCELKLFPRPIFSKRSHSERSLV